MEGPRSRIRVSAGVAIAAGVVLAGAACTAAPSRTSISATGTAAPAAISSGYRIGASPTVPGGRDLLLLGAGPGGSRGLWSFTVSDGWLELQAVPWATTVARFGDAVALAGPSRVELLASSEPAASRVTVPLDVPAATSNRPIVALARSPDGTLALITQGIAGPTYLVGRSGSVMTPLIPAPVQPLTPLVGWLDDQRLLVLSTDSTQASRLTVLDVAAANVAQAGSMAGVRDFTVSGDRATLAAATGEAIYAGSLNEILGANPPTPVAAIPDGSVAWGLAVDYSGSALALLTATVGTDGTAGATREVGYRRSGRSWTPLFDVPVPLAAVVGQVWAP